jgi:hypothetical protein
VGPKLVYDTADMAKMLTCGTLENFMTTWNTLFLKNAYMWDPTEFYYDLEHSVFKIMLTCGTVRWWDLDSPRGFQSLWFSCSARWNLRLRTQRLRMSTRNTKKTASLYWFGPPESKTLCPVVGVDYLRIAYGTRVASPALYWPVDEVGSHTPGRLRPWDLSLVDYIACHILLICFGQNPSRSCLVRQVLRSC